MRLRLSQAKTGTYVIAGTADLAAWTPGATKQDRRIYRVVPARPALSAVGIAFDGGMK
jgi:hypothetical protein